MEAKYVPAGTVPVRGPRGGDPRKTHGPLFPNVGTPDHAGEPTLFLPNIRAALCAVVPPSYLSLDPTETVCGATDTGALRNRAELMLAIRNIGELVLPGFESVPTPNTAGFNVLKSAYVALDQGMITGFGHDNSFDAPADCEVIDAQGMCVVPGLVDCHTHTVFAGSREHELVKRIQGKGYAEIAEEGGGINGTVRAVRQASLDELVELALPRLARMLANGVTTVEIKSGYGLTVDDEIKMLHVVKRLNALQPIELVATLLAAHTIPPECTAHRSEYVDLVCGEDFLARVAGEGLAEFCDVFCERSAFTVEESRRVLLAAKEHGLTPKLHADQITQMGATRLAAEVGAISADHLDTIDEEGPQALKQAGVIGVLLPACSFFLGVEQAPGRRIVDVGLPVAVATDYNPGSSMVESLPLTMTIACTQMRLTPSETLIATTANAAAAIDRHDRIGVIKPGMQADLVILDVANIDQWMYEPGRNCVRTVIKNGRVVHQRES